MPKPKPEPKRITRLKATNFGGLEELDIKVGQHTKLTGAKGVGKTSVLALVSTVLTGKGLRPHLVKLGEDKATLLVELTDGTTIKRTVKAPSKTTALSVEKDGMHPAKAQAFIDALVGPYAYNPVDIFNKSAKEQAAVVLALTDVAMTADEYAELCGDGLLPDVDYDAHPLLVVADIAKTLFAQRTEINRDLTQKRSAACEAREGIPEGFDADAVRGASLGNLVDERTAARQQNKEREQTEAKLATTKQQLASLREQVKSLEGSHEAQHKWLEENPEIDTAALDKQIHDFEEQADLLRIHDSAKATEAEAAQLSREAEKLTELIDAARAKPGELLMALKELPVEGMGIDAEYGVTINGVPIGDLSDGEMIELAVEIVLRYAGEFPLLLLDGLNALDPDSQAQLRERLVASDCQCFVTLVTEGELVIEEW